MPLVENRDEWTSLIRHGGWTSPHESIKSAERHYSKWMKDRQDRLDSLVTGAWKK
ncbi:MAG: hypothetical protein WCD47_24560 [Candidatus Sulfotelmatobacter sp.]